ncbi:hypothetical protein [Myxococcus sp. RHSTA-1-4]|uniref:hypothetical protein n=1 Tax=Myxococcus sp. RHSTA-1-4 TaxID=2874601 RepID=UPI001CC11CF4|nr:hypothetical protein [Myxococcus sp. RHSTA-1-4]MBZ4420461.1 hypothetical protein [Myxococcus sp. RHSTA-1-4]
MIDTAEEFVRLRMSDKQEEYSRAAHETAEESVWLDVIRRFPEMRKWVAHNKTIPPSIIAVLASDPDPAVRDMIAMKRRAGPAVLLKLSHDSSAGVRQAVAMNAKVPMEILRQLANDPDEDVAEAARGRLDSME